MFVFHFDVDFSDSAAVKLNAAVFLKNHVPARFRNRATVNVSKNILVEITDTVVVRLVALTKNFALDNFFPSGAVNVFIEQKFYGVDDIFR